MLTPIEIENHNFSKKMFGFDKDEVKGFLKLTAENVSELYKEKNGLIEKIETMKKDLEKYHNMEKNLEDTLFLAKDMVDKIKKNTEAEKKLIIENAKNDAKKIVDDSRYEKEKLNISIEHLKNVRNQIIIEIEGIIESHKKMLDTFKHDNNVKNIETA